MYGKLEASDQRIFNKYSQEYPPVIRSIALYIKVYIKPEKPFKAKYFDIAEELFPYYTELCKEFLDNHPFYSIQFKDQDIMEKELRFRGFVPENEYKTKPSKFGYFITNRSINGQKFIYPKRFINTYDTKLMSKYPMYDKYMGMYGIRGLTRYQYSKRDK